LTENGSKRDLTQGCAFCGSGRSLYYSV